MMSIQGAKFLILLLSCSLSMAAQECRIQGQLRDEQGQPLTGVSVFLEKTSLGVYTDEKGNYSLQASPGQYILKAQAVGYGMQQQPVRLREGETLQLNIRLQTEDVELGEVVIMAQSAAEAKRQTAYSLAVVEARQFQNKSTDVNQVLKTTPGIHIREAGGLGSGFSLSLNGLSGNQVRYFIDGVPMENFGSSLSLNNFPINLVENIEVYKGVVPVSLGADALGGAINITTARIRRSFVNTSYTYGSFNTHRAALHAQYAGPRGFFVNLSSFYNHSDNDYRMYNMPVYDLALGNLQGERTVKRFHSAYTSSMVKAEAGIYNKSFADQLSFSFTSAQNFKNYQHPDNNIKRVFGSFNSRNSTQLFSGHYRKEFAKWSVSAYALAGKSTETIADTGTFKYNWAGESVKRDENDPKGELAERRSLFVLQDRILRSQIVAAYQFNKKHKLSAAFSQNYLQREGEDEVDEYNNAFRTPNLLHKNILGLSYTFRSENGLWEATAFGKNYFFGGEIITYDIQARAEQRDIQTAQSGYGLAATYYLTEDWQLKSSFERAYRIPEPHEILGDGIYVNINPALEPETSYNTNLGTRYHKAAPVWSWQAEANLFWRSSRDFIRFAALGPFGQYENLSDVSSKGAEASLALDYRQRWSFNINATYQHLSDQNKEDEGLPNVNYGSKLPNIPYLFGNARLGWKPSFKKFNLGIYWNSRYVHEFFLTWETFGSADAKYIIPSQFTHDLELEVSWQKGRYNLSLNADNLTDAVVYDNFRIPKPGRAFYLKLRYLLK